jgi:hypothetical protein
LSTSLDSAATTPLSLRIYEIYSAIISTVTLDLFHGKIIKLYFNKPMQCQFGNAKFDSDSSCCNNIKLSELDFIRIIILVNINKVILVMS